MLSRFYPLLLIPFALWIIIGLGWYAKLFSRKRYPFDLIASSLLATALVLISSVNYRIQHPPLPTSSSKEICFWATVVEKPAEKENSFQLKLRIEQAENDSLNKQTMMGWLQKSDNAAKLEAGDLLFCQSRISRIENRGNPFEFDYRDYLANQGIYFSCYLKSGKFEKAGKSHFRIRLAAEKFREKLLTILRSNLKKTESFEVISALSLGYRKELTPETRAAFVETGGMHVLAVSGLHVGLIYFFLLKLFSFLKRSHKGKWIRCCLILSILWAYALLTGLSPSVQRATLMFTFLLLAESINRTNSIYNSIAASAFALLLIDSDILFAVGFQLSYAAVLSIVYFYPLINGLVPSKNPIVKKPWQLLCVSLAAQIGTFPLSIYYFNQFPFYFWLSNFVVIPAAFVLLAGTFSLFIATPLPALQHGIAFLLEGTNSAVLIALKFISRLPGAVVSGISITPGQLTAIILAILFIILFINLKQVKFIRYALISLIAFLVIGINEKRQLFNQHRLLVYENKQAVFHFIDGRSNFILTSDTTELSPYVYSNTLTKLQLDEPQIILISDFLQLREKQLFIENDIYQFGLETYILSPENKKPKLTELRNAVENPPPSNSSNKSESEAKTLP
ncbi:ComEC/Rec2 family competence protein [Mangrovibacterium diazotrophicum]|nr:ComEC/Rec2 family competence protein [Mangrovibacterium diazotrophicum]